MGLDYFIYNTKTGNLISCTRFSGMPFLYEDAVSYIHTCVARGGLYHIDEWTIDEDSELYKEEMNKPLMFRDDDMVIYCSKNDILNLQKLMTVNKTVLEELMTKDNSDGLIVRIF